MNQIPRPMRTLGRTIARKFWLPTPDSWAPVLVISPGGVGTTFLMHHIRRFKSTNHFGDDDHLKHLPRPPRAFPGNAVAVLFVSGDAGEISKSLERRGYLDHHCCKLGCVAGLLAKGDAKHRHFARAVDAQKRSWSEAGLPHLLFVDYDEIWSRKEEIAAFLEIEDPAFVDEFPERKQRKSAD